MGKSSYYARELPSGNTPPPLRIEPGDRVQKPRSPVAEVQAVSRDYGAGNVVLFLLFVDSGRRTTWAIRDGDDLSDWGYAERGS